MKLVGAVADTPGRAASLARQLAADSACGPQSAVHCLHSGPRAALFAIGRPEESVDADVLRTSTDAGDHLWFVGDGLELHACDSPGEDGIEDEAARLQSTLEGGFLGARIDAGDRLWLHTDSWGLCWTFLRHLRGAVIFGSDFAAICRAGEDALTIDRDSLLLELAIGFSPNEQTIFRGVTVAPPGAVVHVGSDRVEIVRQETFEYGDAWVGKSRQAKFERLDTLFDAMAARTARLAGGEAAISLSAGYDSRYALACLARRRAVGKLMTFGERESDEVVDARNVAQGYAASPDWEAFAVPATRWMSWRSMIQSLGNAGIVQWCGWADAWMEFVRERAHACTIGYLGDALSGKRFDMLPPMDAVTHRLDGALAPWARRWIGFEFDMGDWAQSPLLRPEARRDLLRVASERFGAIAARAEFAQEHQPALHCNLFGRQRRWVASQPVLLATHVRPLTFFADRAFREFWTNVELGDLVHQDLYLRYAEDRFPKLFPQGPSAMRRLATRAGNKVRREIRRALGRKPPPKRPPPIVRAKMLEPHYANIDAALSRTAPVLDDIVDIPKLREAIVALEKGDDTHGLSSGMLFRTVNVMHLADLRNGEPAK